MLEPESTLQNTVTKQRNQVVFGVTGIVLTSILSTEDLFFNRLLNRYLLVLRLKSFPPHSKSLLVRSTHHFKS